MAESLANILRGKNLGEPEEIRIIKKFAWEHFRSKVAVQVQKSQIIVSVPNASLAGTLRLHSHKMAEACQTDKRLVIRIS